MGRIVIPKPMRDALGIDGPTELELTERDGALELTVPYSKPISRSATGTR